MLTFGSNCTPIQPKPFYATHPIGWGGVEWVGVLTFGSNCTPVQRKLFCAPRTNMYTRSVLCCAHMFSCTHACFKPVWIVSYLTWDFISLLWRCVDNMWSHWRTLKFPLHLLLQKKNLETPGAYIRESPITFRPMSRRPETYVTKCENIFSFLPAFSYIYILPISFFCVCFFADRNILHNEILTKLFVLLQITVETQFANQKTSFSWSFHVWNR